MEGRVGWSGDTEWLERSGDVLIEGRGGAENLMEARVEEGREGEKGRNEEDGEEEEEERGRAREATAVSRGVNGTAGLEEARGDWLVSMAMSLLAGRRVTPLG